ncbi:hypothetical protein IJ090_00540, partial [Candidatus Saccharibacteria bacterium]|nr:hypothetical protein [Candidatus Saccharibacteria bacterium]
MKKSAFIIGFTGTLLTGLIVKMPTINAEDAPLCVEGNNIAITASSGETYLTGNCTLNKDFNGNLVVGDNITATLNLNGKTITNNSGIALRNLGNLTIVGDGNVIGGSTNYTVQNQNTLRIEGGSYSTTAEIKTSSGPSLIANGWNLTSAIGATPAEKPAGSASYATLEIAGGEFNGGLNNIKNDENGILRISGGTFEDLVGQKNSVLHGGKSL